MCTSETLMTMIKDRGVQSVLAVVSALLLLSLGGTASAMMGMGGGGDTCTSTISIMPNVDKLSPITSKLTSPTAVAIDKEGRIYVANLHNNTVVIFSQSGRYLKGLRGLDNPISVAVDESGKIFVGNDGRGNVEVYDADFKHLFKLGSGDGEFSRPNDITVDGLGRVFVADTENNVVKVFNAADGIQSGVLGGSGTNDGEFHRPLSIAIDESAQEIVVLDQNPGTWGELEAKVQFFNMEGVFQRSFKAFGSGTGQMTGPERIVVDSQSRIYLTDSLLNTVIVYDNVGCYVGVVFETKDHPIAPMGLAIGKNNKLYVTSHVTKSVEVYGLYELGSYGYTGMKIDPTTLAIRVKEGSGVSVAETVSVQNTGSGSLDWNAETHEEWLLLSGGATVSDTAGTRGESLFEVTVDPTGLEPGVYKGKISFSGGKGLAEEMEVTLTVKKAPILNAIPEALTFVAKVGASPAPQTFSVSNHGSLPLYWSVTKDKDWIFASPTQGTLVPEISGEDTVKVLADATSLNVGIHKGTITLSGHNCVNGPINIDVTLVVVPSPEVPDPTSDDRVFGDMSWTLQDILPSVALNSVWTSSDSQVFAVGQEGMILHYDGTDWGIMESPTALDLFGVWGVVDPKDDTTGVYAVGQDGIVLHYDGASWNTIMLFGTDLTGIWGTSGIDVYAVGLDGTILQYNGTNWSTMGSPTSNDLYGIWGIFDEGTNNIDIFAVGERGTVLSSDGSDWRIIKTSTKADLYDVWGSSPFDMYAVGEDGTIIKSAAHRWSTAKSVSNRDLNGIWGSSGSDIYAVGTAGTILRYDGNDWSPMDSSTSKDLKAVWGSHDLGVLAAGQDMTMLHYDGGDWQSLVSALEGLNSVWGRSANDVFTVGMLGSILHYNGTNWSTMDSQTDKTLNSVWGSYLTDTFAVGMKGTILRYRGGVWSTMSSPTNKTLYDIWGASPTNLYTVGQRGIFLHYDGTRWSTVKSKIKEDLYSIWGRSASDVYMVGQDGAILHYNGYAISAMASPTSNDLYSVRVCDESVFAVGQAGTFLSYDGISWASLDAGTTSNLYDVWCSSDSDVVIVGQDDTFLYYDGNSIEAVDFGTESSLRGVWGSTETTDIFAVGAGGAIIHGINE